MCYHSSSRARCYVLRTSSRKKIVYFSKKLPGISTQHHQCNHTEKYIIFTYKYCSFSTVSSSRVTLNVLDKLPVYFVTHLRYPTNLFRVTSAHLPKMEATVFSPHSLALGSSTLPMPFYVSRGPHEASSSPNTSDKPQSASDKFAVTHKATPANLSPANLEVCHASRTFGANLRSKKYSTLG